MPLSGRCSITTAGWSICASQPPIAPRSFQGGSSEITYHIDGVPDFWIGEAAMRNGGRALPIGPTTHRLPDPRQIVAGMRRAHTCCRRAGGLNSDIA
ncbi:MAG TPA: hypothetical protein VFX76_08660 [Roseiflexaceae bacterium]|nr:hypothetical protein [Roseiflexaceae bacterium]